MNFSLTTTGGLYDNYEKERLSTLGFVFKDRRLDPLLEIRRYRNGWQEGDGLS